MTVFVRLPDAAWRGEAAKKGKAAFYAGGRKGGGKGKRGEK